MACSIKTKEELKLTSKQTAKLVELYSVEADLWNDTSPNYYTKDYRRSALQRIKDNLVKECKIVCSVEQIQTKLSYLRGYYARELARIHNSKVKRSGSWGGEVYASSWIHFRTMDSFLKNRISPRTSRISLDATRCRQDKVTANGKGQHDTPSQCSEAPTKKSRPSGSELVVAEAIECLREFRKSTNEKPSPTTPEDEDTIFGNYVACELRKVPDERTKAFLKFKIQSLIFETRYGNSQEPLCAQSEEQCQLVDVSGK